MYKWDDGNAEVNRRKLALNSTKRPDFTAYF